jgi:fumarate hydratase class II
MTDANEPAPKVLNLPIGLDATGVRQEFDSLGKVEVPADHYWGAQTQRSLQHFNIGNDRMPKEVYHAYGYVKKAAATVNARAGRLPEWKGELIERVCDEVISGALDEQFPLYVFQTGSGTQSNMNVNDVISNRCIQLVGGTLGSQEPIHPNDHVNMRQSSNDTFPTAMHIAAYKLATERTIPALKRLRDATEHNAKKWADVVKIGRTHLEDATPLTVGQEWSGYAGALDDAIAEVDLATRGLLKLAMGGTAVGTGLNTPRGFGEEVAAEIASMTGAPFETAANKFTAQGTLDRMVRAHGGLKAAAVTLFKIANDVRWLGSGPRTGRYRRRSLCQARRLAATTIVAHRVTAVAPQSTQDVAAGVRWAWACSTRVTMAAPMAATAPVSGRWVSIHCAVAAGVGRGARWPAKSKYVHQAPKPITTAVRATARVSALVGLAASPSRRRSRLRPGQ